MTDDAILDEVAATMDSLAAAPLAPLFRRPVRTGVDSAWYGHVPFAHWLIPAIAPRLVVELGTHAGVSYAAFCESVRLAGLATTCLAVDTWQGDEHAGFYGEEIYAELKQFHDARYGSFSTLLRRRFDQALDSVADGSVDLLHVDGRHRYEDAREDYTSWIPKLSDRAVVLFHDTRVHDHDFGVWKLWAELSARHPNFEFAHGHGLGVLAHGTDIPEPVARLCAAREPALLRDRFAVLGERWEIGDVARRTDVLLTHERHRRATAERQGRTLSIQLAGARSTAGLFEHQLAEQAKQVARAEAELTQARHVAESALLQAQLAESRLHAALSSSANTVWGQALEARAQAAEAEAGQLRHEKAIILGSTSWRATRPLRAAIARLRGTPPALPELQPLPEPTPEPVAQAVAPDPAAPVPEPAPAPTGRPRDKILFVSGEPHTPGSRYRCIRYAEAARTLGHEADWCTLAGITAADLVGCALVVLWRVQISPHVETLCEIGRREGARIAFDIDDLMVRPELATAEIIDGIRTTRSVESETRDLFVRIRQAIDLVDFCTCTTEELAFHLRQEGQDTHILPNGFDDATLRRSRHAVRHRAAPDGLFRIGYAGGTRTHQRDFGRAVPGLVRLLAERPETRLVLFRDPASGEGLVLVEEFPELAALSAQIEWRDMVDHADLPAELVRFDVNIVPLETGNVFAEAKSELKYFEAALVDVPSIASPTGPLARAVADGRTGLLAADDEGWFAALDRLAADPEFRRRLGHAAHLDALGSWGPHRQQQALQALLDQLGGGMRAANAFQLGLLRRGLAPAALPTVPEHDVLFHHDAGGDAEASVIVPLYNYERYLLETLESVRHQTLAPLDLIVVDDASTDASAALAEEWMHSQTGRFNRLVLRRNRRNSGLGFTRNSGFDAAETPFVLPVDADNRLLPTACVTLLNALRDSGAAFAHSLIQEFGDRHGIMGRHAYTANRLVGANTIDAMAMIGKWAWALSGGYQHVRFGWEDYDLWCRMAERALWGVQVPEILAEYRTHAGSMIHTATEIRENRSLLVADLELRHDWLKLTGER